jgi:flagellar basal body-associated protein FliL
VAVGVLITHYSSSSSSLLQIIIMIITTIIILLLLLLLVVVLILSHKSSSAMGHHSREFPASEATAPSLIGQVLMKRAAKHHKRLEAEMRDNNLR